MDITEVPFTGIVSVVIPVGGFLYWHFKEIHKLKDQIQDLKLEMKNLENKDNLQQQTIDQLKELYPIFKSVIEKLNTEKK